MKNKLLYTCMTSLAILLATVNPQNSLTPEQTLVNVNGYLTLLTAVYNGVEGYGYWGRDIILEGDALSDNIVTNNSQSGNRYSTANVNSAGATFNIWQNNYFYINQLNTIIAGIGNLTGLTVSQQALEAQILAQSYALRGLLYFDLARVYGWEPNNIPTSGPDAGFNFSAVLRLTPINTPDLASPKQNRSTIAQTYTQIEADFNKAISLFQAAGTSKPAVPYSFSESSAHGFLAKVYLYARDYPNCVTQCQAALNPTICSATLTPAGTYSKAFKSIPNPESLLELDYVQTVQVAGVTGSNGSPYTYTQPTGYGFTAPGLPGGPNAFSTFGGQTVSPELIAAFESPNDDRKAMFYNSRTATTLSVFTWCNKYSGANGPYTDNIPMLRYSDVLLMQAEALAAQGQFPAAQALVIQLRAARNALTVTVPADITLNQFIQDERRRELFFEGNRFFDLKRTGLGVTKAAATGVGTLSPGDYRLIAPLPASEVLFNPALPQNPNY
jgi:hypothetical protein